MKVNLRYGANYKREKVSVTMIFDGRPAGRLDLRPDEFATLQRLLLGDQTIQPDVLLTFERKHHHGSETLYRDTYRLPWRSRG